mmetsp:Transcript_53651/g.117087  ORF Transcript_53651/g.117087 Transcript_53651/m.117087 type:complete len:308 (+) Transcript_53651:51-974(+)
MQFLARAFGHADLGLAGAFAAEPDPDLLLRRAKKTEERAEQRLHAGTAEVNDELRDADEQRRYLQSLSQSAHAASIVQALHADALERELQAESVVHDTVRSELDIARAELRQEEGWTRASLDSEAVRVPRLVAEARQLRAWFDKELPTLRNHHLSEERAIEAQDSRNHEMYQEVCTLRAVAGREARQTRALQRRAESIEEEVTSLHSELVERRFAEQAELRRVFDEAAEHQYLAARARVFQEHETAERMDWVQAQEKARLARLGQAAASLAGSPEKLASASGFRTFTLGPSPKACGGTSSGPSWVRG